ncbi:unnamed protein product [Chondrus crispus]|uniref:Uncharacterized protein n=1 Tax=Chondrus crispus TaxID=2769 RepID=R7QJE3_CHOCR|nr:unnamed protein product [Chondrus crispus]CDF38637.1 unnamed protein product [Chondrus crispus]|eukprot:XP_005718542.1 unnamed protein product [Chondrus crispus]
MNIGSSQYPTDAASIAQEWKVKAWSSCEAPHASRILHKTGKNVLYEVMETSPQLDVDVKVMLLVLR